MFPFNPNATTKNNDRVGRVQWVRAGLALGYSHPNITGFPRSKIFIGDSVKFDQKIIIVCIVLLLELNRYTMVGDTSAGEYNLRVAEVETLFFTRVK